MTVLRTIVWYMNSLMGDHDYDHYVAHLHSTHTDVVPLSKRAYWRERYAAADRAPGTRCC
jgi:uncharacterized short protein YbdD (DUF466 family)